jgi:hypothetical protein
MIRAEQGLPMQRLDRVARNEDVAKTGRIPPGTMVSAQHLRNPSLQIIKLHLAKTRAEIATGTCHPDWGRKQIEVLQALRAAKLKRISKRRK